ncbi:MAG: MOSC domain-containing protein [Tetrasphaera sp.]
MPARVVAVCRDTDHRFSKPAQAAITLVAGLGVEGDAHSGTTVKHRSRVRKDPAQPNLRQVHLIHSELFAQAAERGYALAPGDLGENITTAGLDLLVLPVGTRVRIGDAVLRVTGLRNPCQQINAFRPGLLRVVVGRPDGVRTDSEVRLGPTGGALTVDGQPVVRKAGIMAVVETGGVVRPGDVITVEIPAGPPHPLTPV